VRVVEISMINLELRRRGQGGSLLVLKVLGELLLFFDISFARSVVVVFLALIRSARSFLTRIKTAVLHIVITLFINFMNIKYWLS